MLSANKKTPLGSAGFFIKNVHLNFRRPVIAY